MEMIKQQIKHIYIKERQVATEITKRNYGNDKAKITTSLHWIIGFCQKMSCKITNLHSYPNYSSSSSLMSNQLDIYTNLISLLHSIKEYPPLNKKHQIISNCLHSSFVWSFLPPYGRLQSSLPYTRSNHLSRFL